MGMSLGHPPNAEEAEVSVFGPGFGESLAIHLGFRQWVIVDSCIARKSNRPAALEYLEGIGIDVARDVVLVIATHWHDDHIRGLGQLVRTCKSAEFVCSQALRDGEFLTLVQGLSTGAQMLTTGVSEFSSIICELKRRKRKRSNKKYVPKFAIADRLLWKRNGNETPGALPAKIYSLAPSDASVRVAFERIAKLIPIEDKAKKRIPSLSPNDSSVVLWFSIGNLSALLGADLEETEDPLRGWTVILDSQTRPTKKADLFKIPHHGAQSSHNLRVWQEMVETNAPSGTTPFQKGNVSLPTNADMKRIISLTNQAFLTAAPSRLQTKTRSRAVRRSINDTVRWIREMDSRQGHIRLRKDALNSNDSTWKVELFGAATPIAELL